ncbi:zinc finger protein OZF [Harpegnathos saltator]|nr:zinc finger protein OZF [Harpegnathos saltator]
MNVKLTWSSTDNDTIMKEILCNALTWNDVTSSEVEQVEHVEESSSTRKVNFSAAATSRRNSARVVVTSRAASQVKKKEKIFCDICKITFGTRGTKYRKHMLKHSSHYPFQCDICKKKFKHKINMNRHKMKVHGEAPLYSCQYCDFSTIHCSYLQVHFTRKHTDDFHFSCDKCDRKFRIKADYTKHLITHEGDPCICDVCGSALANKMSLYFHKNYKHRVKDAKFQCPVCKKKLQTQKNLDSHVQQHEQRYMCEECGLELTRKSSLKKHIKTHSGEKPYLCHICGKGFANPTGRKVHLLTHSEVRPYICTICGQSFTQRPALSVHWKKKHPDVTDAPPPVSIKNIIASITHNSGKTQ